MTRTNLIEILGLNLEHKPKLKSFLEQVGITSKELKYYSDNNILPSETILERMSTFSNKSIIEIQLLMGIIPPKLLPLLSTNAKQIAEWLSEDVETLSLPKPKKVFETSLGTLYEGDCLALLQSTASESFDVVFADPPFNLNKQYLSKFDDNQSPMAYLDWCLEWLEECIRCLKQGGSLFIWNLPKWNGRVSSFLSERLNFRHWIAADIKQSLPIQGKLYPAHYSLLYFVKGEKPNVYHSDRLPMDVCRHCLKETKDYGGYKDKMNPLGINLTDIWLDIPPVRHAKYKKRVEANELSIKLLDRIIEMSSNEDDVIFDPFGGSGTTYAVAEMKRRKWIGVELGPTGQIIERLSDLSSEKQYLQDIRGNYNQLFSPSVKERRKKLGIWTDESFPDSKK